MKIGIISIYMDYRRRGEKSLGAPQPGIGPLIAGLLPGNIEIDVINETLEDPDWNKDYDLLYISCLHSDFDRARQVSHYWRRRGATTVFGGPMASAYPGLCKPYFDVIAVGDAEGNARAIYDDFCAGELKPFYVSQKYDPANVPVPRFDLLAGKSPVPIFLEATRGCPFSCDFCALTGIGTRFHTRPPESIVRDIQEGQRMLREKGVSWLRRKIIGFHDNNIGGNPAYLKKLADALTPLNIRWASAITFNALQTDGMLKQLARSGCRTVFVGLETFNPETLTDMRKFQNVLDEARRLIDDCRSHGLLLHTGLMISPQTDNWDYIQTIPERVRKVGLHMPIYISFEAPIPGTPFFNRLAGEPEPAFMPKALLRDFTGNTLVVKPKRESRETHIEGYKWLLDNTFTRRAQLRKFADDIPRLVAGGGWDMALMDVAYYSGIHRVSDPERSYMAGTDMPPPEASNIPFTADDFDSEEERRKIVDPWPVTDDKGHILPHWMNAMKVFEGGGRISPAAIEVATNGKVRQAAF